MFSPEAPHSSGRDWNGAVTRSGHTDGDSAVVIAAGPSEVNGARTSHHVKMPRDGWCSLGGYLFCLFIVLYPHVPSGTRWGRLTRVLQSSASPLAHDATHILPCDMIWCAANRGLALVSGVPVIVRCLLSLAAGGISRFEPRPPRTELHRGLNCRSPMTTDLHDTRPRRCLLLQEHSNETGLSDGDTASVLQVRSCAGCWCDGKLFRSYTLRATHSERMPTGMRISPLLGQDVRACIEEHPMLEEETHQPLQLRAECGLTLVGYRPVSRV